MATPPRKRRYSSLHALPPAIERALERVERDPRLHSLNELLAGLRQVAPAAFRDVKAAEDAAIFSDREHRVKMLAERARLGVGLFHDGDTVHLPPDAAHGGRHHRRRGRPA